MSLEYKKTISIQALALALFGIYLSVAAELFLQVVPLIKLSISFIPPTIGVSLALIATLVAQFEIALGFGLPIFNINFGLALEYELAIVLGLIAAIEAIVSVGLIAYAYVGNGVQFGDTLHAAIGGGWPDGTPASKNVTAFLFVATASGPHTVDQVAGVSLLPNAPTPPTPPSPSPPAGSFPPPQAYENGIANVTFPSQVYPTTIYPANPATGTLVVDSSVSTGIGKITSIAITSPGSGYTSPPIPMISDTVNLVSITPGSPVTLTLPNALTIPVGNGFGVTIAGVTGTPDINGPHFAKVLFGGTSVALYQDQGMSVPIVGAGPYAGGNLTGGGLGASANSIMGGGSKSGITLFFDGLTWPTIGPAIKGGVTTISGMCKGAFALLLALLANLNARKNVLLAATAQLSLSILPPSIEAFLGLLAKMTANLEANLHVTPPSFSAALSAQINVLLDLVGRINLMLGIGNAELEIWAYSGSAENFSTDIAAGPGTSGWHDGSPASTVVAAGVFGLTTDVAAAGFASFFGGLS
jgi:hypothetical protein